MPRRTSPAVSWPLAPDLQARAAGFSRPAGVDEAGCGPWAGPVVAAAVVLRGFPIPVRIDDSKRLTRIQREQAYQVILECADIGIGIVCARLIDQHNILQARLLAMRHAIQDLSHPPDLVLVDGRHAPQLPVPCWLLVDGDRRSRTIACASIIAKVIRDQLMSFYHRLDPRYGFDQHKGYGTAWHAKQLGIHGPSLFHRMSFRPVFNLSHVS